MFKSVQKRRSWPPRHNLTFVCTEFNSGEFRGMQQNVSERCDVAAYQRDDVWAWLYDIEGLPCRLVVLWTTDVMWCDAIGDKAKQAKRGALLQTQMLWRGIKTLYVFLVSTSSYLIEIAHMPPPLSLLASYSYSLYQPPQVFCHAITISSNHNYVFRVVIES